MVQRMPLPPIISCFIKIQIGLTFLVPAYSGCPEKGDVKRVSVIYTYSDFVDQTQVRLANEVKMLLHG